MPEQRETLTDRLANVIEVIQLGRKTGRLSVERGEDNTYEEGSISFLNGQIVQATTGWRIGQEALNWLSSWGACLFTFIPDASARTTGRLPALTASSTPPLSPTTPISQKFPPAAAQPTKPLPSLHPSVAVGKIGKLSGTGQVQPLPTMPAQGTGASGKSTPAPPDGDTPAPYHTRQHDEAFRLLEHRGLSRAHRRLFLLIDGQRTMPELVRLMGRGQDEVQQLLRDLEAATLIRQR